MSVDTSATDLWLRFSLGYPPREEDRAVLRRVVPELFLRGENLRDGERSRVRFVEHIREEILGWLRSGEGDRFVSVRAETCRESGCPLGLGRRSHSASGEGITDQVGDGGEDGDFVTQLMTVAGGWKTPMGVFLDTARKIHGGKGPIRALLVTDGYIYADESQNGNPGGTSRFVEYLSALEFSPGNTLTLLLPPYAKGRSGARRQAWEASVNAHAASRGFNVDFKRFTTRTRTSFHDRFYLARHSNGMVSGLFGPSITGLTDKDFVLIGEIESETLKKLNDFIVDWA